MVYRIRINDNTASPCSWLPDVFDNGAEFKFEPGINIIIGENGCGKSTLLKLIQRYAWIKGYEASTDNIHSRPRDYSGKFPGGVDVFADYQKTIFRFVHPDEFKEDCGEGSFGMRSFQDFGALNLVLNSSTGEGVIVLLNRFLQHIFSEEANPKIDYLSAIDKELQFFKDRGGPAESIDLYNAVRQYFCEHHTPSDEWTILLDEPDRNLSISSLDNILPILNERKENTQIIAVIHNPLLIYKLAKDPDINFIEVTSGYKQMIIDTINNLTTI
jgi:hypothetical protein